MTMPPAQKSLVESIRTAISTESPQREMTMFGGVAFMVNEKMIVSADKVGRLLVRVPADDHERLLKVPGAAQAEMGSGRSMGPGWITVAANHLTEEAAIVSWITVALTQNSSALND